MAYRGQAETKTLEFRRQPAEVGTPLRL